MSDHVPDIIIATIPKNKREELRICLGEFKGHRLCQVRAWALREDADAVATKSGFAIQAALIPALRSALAEAEEKARALGWLGPA